MAALGHTVDSGSGASGDYVSLNALIVAQAQDLTDGGGDTYTATCITTGDGAADATVCNIDGWVPGSGNELTVLGDWTTGVYDATAYHFAPSNQWNAALSLNDNYIILKYLQITNTDGNSNSGDALRVSSSNCVIEECLVYQAAQHGIVDYGTNNVVVNTIVYGCEDDGIQKAESGGNLYVYNTTIVANGGYGLNARNFRTILAKNIYSGGNTGADYFEDTNGTLTITTCYSDDGSEGTPTAAYSTSAGAYFINITGGSEDLDIGASSGLIGNGTDLSGDGTYPFAVDVIGTARSSWDVGAFEFVAAPAEGNRIPIIDHHNRMMAMMGD